jgi:hypothetical protein
MTTHRVLELVFAIALTLAVFALGGCKEEPPPPEPPNLQKLQPKLEQTKKDIAAAQEQLKATADRIRAEKEARAAKADGGTSEPPQPTDQ